MKIEKKWKLPFPVNLVYHAWVSSKTVIPPATRMDVNPVVGGHYQLFIETPEFIGRNEGKFLVVEPESRLRYTWEWNGDGEVTTVDVRFESEGGHTHLYLEHARFREKLSAENHASGWDAYVEGLNTYLRNL